MHFRKSKWNTNRLIIAAIITISLSVVLSSFPMFMQTVSKYTTMLSNTLNLTITSPTYTVTLDENYQGGSSSSTITVTYGETYSALSSVADPTRANFIFDGWYTAASSGTQVTNLTTVSETRDHTLYAHWTSSAVFDTGQNVNAKMKTLSSGSSQPFTYSPTNVRYIRRSNTDPSTLQNLRYSADGTGAISQVYTNVAASGSIPIYMWFDSGTIYWYCSDTTPILNVDSSYMFSYFPYVTSLNFYDFNINTSEVTNMSNMFSGCNNLTSLDVTNFNTSEVTDMSSMFSGCNNLTSLDVTNFNTSEVTNMNSMFTNCQRLTSLDLASFNTGQVTNMDSMFARCTALETIYASNNFVTTNVTSSTNMFNSCSNLVGGARTRCDGSSNIDKTYARIDNPPGSPGYFTEATHVTVTFDAGDGTVSPSIKNVIYGSTYNTLPTPTLQGYWFIGWYTQAEGGTEVTSSTLVTNSSAHTLHAHWSDTRPITVTFDADADIGSVNPSSKTVFEGETYGALPTPTLPGELSSFLTFVGWSSSSSSFSEVTSSTTVNTSSNHTLYAVYQTNVTFCSGLNGSTTSTVPMRIINQMPINNITTPASSQAALPANGVGWAFAGWKDNGTASAAGIVGGETTITPSSLVYYAVYSRTITVSYNANGGTGTIPNSTDTQYYSSSGRISPQSINMPISIDGNLTAPSGYDFSGWGTTSDSTSGSYDINFGVSDPQSAAVYAIWSRNVDFVHCDGNIRLFQYYTSSGASTITTPDSSVAALPANDVGWTFAGWKAGIEASAAGIVGGETTITPSSNYYFAVYSRTLSTSFAPNGGSGSTSLQSPPTQYYNSAGYISSFSFNLPNSSFTAPAGYSFAGWGLTANATSGSAAGSSFEVNKGVSEEATFIMYAIWSRNITFYSGQNRSASTTVTQYYTSGGASTITTPASSMAELPANDVGWIFVGWKPGTSASTTDTVSGEQSITPSSTSYYAVFSRTLTINYNANGGTGTTPSSTGTQYYNSYGNLSSASIRLSSNSFTPPAGYSFAGAWGSSSTATSGSAAGSNYAVTTAVADSPDLTMYAIWSRNITFYSGQNRSASTTVPQYYRSSGASSITTPANATLPATGVGWSLAGWKLGTDASTTDMVNAGASLTPSTPQCFAVFSRTLTVSYNANGGTGTTPSSTTTQYYNSAGIISPAGVTISGSSFTPPSGQAFDGWATSSSGPVRYRIGDIFDIGVSSSASAPPLYAIYSMPAIFDTGQNVCAKMKTLAAGTSKTYSTSNSTITSFQRSNTSPDTLGLTLSANGTGSVGTVYVNVSTSSIPIYMWYDSGTIYWYSPDATPALNATSSYMFYGYTGLTSLDVSNFDTSQVTDMYYMFYYCSKLTSLDVSNFDTSKVTNMSYMFYRCSGLTNLDLSSFDTSQVTNMSYMFYNCSGLTSLDVSNFDTSQVTNMSYMFSYCSALRTIYASSNFVTAQVTSGSSMFYGCSSLVGGNGTTYNSSYTDKTYARVDGGIYRPGYFTGKSSVTVNFNACGGTVSPASQSVINGAPYNTLPTPTRAGYSFLGWFTESEGGEGILSSSIVTSTSEHTLYAHWTNGPTATVTFIPGDNCTVSPSSKVVAQSGTYGTLPTPTIPGGYTFLGWFTAASGGTQVTSSSTLATSSNHAIYAHYDITATFKTGSSVCSVMKTLSQGGNSTISYSTGNTLITSVQRSTTAPPAGRTESANGTGTQGAVYTNVAAASGSAPIYMWYDSGIIYWYTVAQNIYLNGTSSYMFQSMSNVTSIDLSGINASQVTNSSYMFNSDSNLTTIYASESFDTSITTSSANMFGNCSNKLKGGNNTTWSSSNVTAVRAKLDGRDGTGYLTYRAPPS